MNDSEVIDGLILSLGKKEYSFGDLKYLTEPFGISETSLRTHMSRMIRKGFYAGRKEGKSAFYSLSEKGNKISGNISNSFNTPDWIGWDGSWLGVVFSVPETEKPLRHRIRVKLEAYRFAPWYGGFWIRPYHPKEKISFETTAGCRIIHFTNLTEITAEEADRLWKLEAVGKKMETGIEIISREITEGKVLPSGEALVKRIDTGNRIVSFLFSDPLLPPALLPPGWPGDELRKLFKKWDRIILEQSKPYWEKIFRRIS